MEYKDYYQILGVDKNATADAIKSAYRKLARKYHPDLSKEPDAAQRMAEVNEANAVLSDPEKRAAYDAVGAQAWAAGARSGDDVRPPPGWNAGFEFSDAGNGYGHHGQGGFDGFGGFSGFGNFGAQGDQAQHSAFFEELFGRATRARQSQGARAHAGNAPMRGEDQHATIELALPDAYHGVQRTITLRGLALDAQGQLQPQERVLEVKIPRGVKPGQLIRLAGQGGPGFNGGPAGDLLLQVQFADDARWRIDGRDVTQTLRVAPWEALLGATVEVTMPDGATAEVRVPEGSNTGRKLRVKGRGIPAANAAGTAGDLYLELEMAVPGAVTEAQKTAWAALREAYPGFDPRRA